MKSPRWIEKKALLLLHVKALARFGGAGGLRDEGLLDSALARPINVFLHGAKADLPTLAAAYGFGLAKNHAFIDGNKRIAFMAVGLFLELNGWSLRAVQADAISAINALAAGTLSETELAAWIRVNAKRRRR